MFPNPYSIYLHDTPSRELFSRNQRTYSSGCIRISNPVELADYLLKHDPAEQADHHQDRCHQRQATGCPFTGGSAGVPAVLDSLGR
ncbi:MAG: L,D-transpeptidase family protein [Candidatus Competibacteraceae bacterium]